MEALILFVGGCALFAGALILGFIFNGYVLSVLWGWFVVPVFNLPRLSLVSAIGIVLVVSFLAHQYRSDDKDEDEAPGEVTLAILGKTMTRGLITLFFGWILQFFM